LLRFSVSLVGSQRFARILWDFHQIKTFEGTVAPRSPPPPTPVAWTATSILQRAVHCNALP